MLLALTLLLAATPGLDVSAIDKSIAPGDNFFQHANGAWLKANAIPDDRSSWGVGSVLVEQAQKQTVELIQTAADAGTPEGRKVADAYASFMDEAGVEAKGLKPIKPKVDAAFALKDKTQLAKALGATLRADVDPLNATNFETRHLFGLFVAQALEDPTTNRAYLLQGGLGMPDREYYVDESPRMVELRAKYLAYVTAVLKLGGVAEPDAKAAKVVALEKKMAQVHATRTESEDVHGTQVWKREELQTQAPGLDWFAFLDAAQLEKQSVFTFWHPKATVGLAALVGSEPLDTWKAWLAFHTLAEASPYLPKAFVEERFAFYGKAINGTPKLRDRWKRAVDFTSGVLPEAIGQLYVSKHFPPESKMKAKAMVNDIIQAFDKRIDALKWMTPATKKKAHEKVATLKVGVGYPDVWRDYSKLEIKPDDVLGNAQRASLNDYQYALGKLGKAPDRGEWWMVPQEVNAVNLPLQNAMNFPAAILQPPYFDPNREALLNYGAIGAVIGHEITHSFDNLGAEFDAQGKLSNWWTKEDAEHFEAAGKKLIAQYDAYEPLPGAKVSGKMTLAENIADVAGLAAAYDAYKLSLKGKAAPVLDKLSGDQRFFLSFAHSWREKSREEALRAQIIGDGHAPEECRGNTVRNLDAWYAAFGVKSGQKLFLKPADRVKVW